MAAPVYEVRVDGLILHAAIISFDAPSRQKRKRKTLERAGLGHLASFASTAEEFKEACDVDVDFLALSIHGNEEENTAYGWTERRKGFRKEHFIPISELHGKARTLLVLSCYGGSGDHPALWKSQFSATHLVAAAREPENVSAYNGAVRILRNPAIWADPSAIAERYKTNGRARRLAEAGWSTY